MTAQEPSFLTRVGGLVMQIDRPIVGLRSLDVPEAPDVSVRMRGSSGVPPANQAGSDWYLSPDHDDRDVPFLTIRTIESGYVLRYAEGTTFLVSRSGAEVDAWWDAPLADVDAADYLFGGVLAFIVRLRGMVPLHASGVVVQEQAILFAGAQGTGKSSLAAAFAILGYPVIADDIVVIDDARGGVIAYPSHPRLSLWPDSASHLFAAQTLPAHSPVYEKRRLDLLEHGHRVREGALPVGMICLLATREASSRPPVIRALPPRAALMKLVSQTYGNYLLDASLRAREFDILGRVADSVGVSELSVGADLEKLVTDCRLLADCLALQSAAQVT